MRNIKKWVNDEYKRFEWYVCAKPYRYIAISLLLNLFESLMLLLVFLRLYK